MAKRGRKEKKEYILENLEVIEQMVSKGYPEKDICKHLGIGISTFSKYKKELIELSTVLNKAKKTRLEELENISYKTAMGFEYTEEKTIIQLDENGNPSRRVKEVYRKRALPNPAMQQYLMNNWSDGKYTKDPMSAKFKEEELKLKKEANELMKDWDIE